jgi:hypothetical protein
VYAFDEFCDYILTDTILNPERCNSCSEASGSMIATLFISLIMCFPSITTSVLRLYPHYDCNCQKVFGGFAAVLSVGFALYTFSIYQYRCFRSFGFGTTCINDEGDSFESWFCPPGYQEVQLKFWAGPGWIALSTASGLKLLDMLFNLAIPTPTICRDHAEQRQYEMLANEMETDDADEFVEE